MTRHLIGILILSSAVIGGCERDNPPPPTVENTGASATAAQQAADRAATDTKAAVDRAAAEAKAAADHAAADIKAAADRAAAEAEAAADRAAADETSVKASSLLEQLLAYIKDNKLDLAQTTLTELDGMKASLPASLQDQIETARTALNAKKAASLFPR